MWLFIQYISVIVFNVSYSAFEILLVGYGGGVFNESNVNGFELACQYQPFNAISVMK